MKRVILGFMFAPLGSGLMDGIIMGNFGAFISDLLFAYPFSLILGIPAFLLFKKLSWLNLWSITSAGTILGIIVGLIFIWPFSFDIYSIQSDLTGLGLFGFHGFVVSFVFWLIAFKRYSSNKALNSMPPAAGTPKSGAL